MMNIETASAFVGQRIDAFNAHNLEQILDHYADDIEFYSPFIPLLKFNEEGVIRGKPGLRAYFEAGLAAYPELRFTLQQYYTGINTVVISYTSVNGRSAAETFQLNGQGKAVRVYCNYFPAIPVT
ncbi:nuclear transport factor 2 family protein [Panacibacter ginsenosidivorans]|uniref:Nuclear transport factor 2 family protein n=1 Tax=Panacibacter ginsenosidivorans TaxID=1813871 RepID=A0A5B8VCN1_9BACT|nr:nuclear transport factor 2 family protein [Panacibacter ginsenosidivorans]QEC69287.1 nuclear transport factor 2 family protein [Panacibacter ginsenosidivorans]